MLKTQLSLRGRTGFTPTPALSLELQSCGFSAKGASLEGQRHLPLLQPEDKQADSAADRSVTAGILPANGLN